MTNLENFTDYCTKNGLPDSIAVYALWNGLEEEKRRNELLQFQLEFARKMIEKLGNA